VDFKLPDIGEGIAEGEIVKWKVSEGDAVREDQPLVEVMTDKATVEIPSPRKGVIRRIVALEGKVVPVGSVIVVIDESGLPANSVGASSAAAGAAPAVHAVAAVGSHAPVASHDSAVAMAERPVVASGKVLATPATRKLARDLGVDIGQVTGSGPRGRVMKDDVRSFAGGKKAPSAPAAASMPSHAPAAGREERIPVRGLRRRIAQHLVHSKHTAPHFTYVEECDMTEMVELRVKAKDIADKRGVKLTYLPFIMKALVIGLKEFPLLNASMDDERQEVVLKRYYNLGVATAAPEGLVVPVVKDCDKRSILDLAREVDRVSEDARQGKSKLEDLQGGTFSITSLGALGGILATPIINHPEVAILGVHKIAKRPVVRDDQIVIRHIMYLSISLDHRVVDGVVGAQFLQRVVRFLEDPKLLLLEGL